MGLFNKNINPKTSLVLAGGGARLAYHAGVLMAMEEAQLVFNHVDGASGGIFGTAMMASGVTPKEAAAGWRKLKLRWFMGMLPVRYYLGRNPAKLMDGADGMRDEIYPTLGIDIKKINSNTDIDATFNVCNFSKKVVESIPHTTATIDHLIAGMSLPMFMPAIKINGDWYTDAVWIKDCNLTVAVNKGAQEIWLVWCIGNTHEYLKGYFNQYVHMIEISANAALIGELTWIQQQNEALVQQGLPAIKVHIIKPDFALPLDPDFFLNKIDADTLINMGYADTKKYLKEKKPFDFKDITGAAAMQNVTASLHFRQQFTGQVSINGSMVRACIHLAFFIREMNGAYVWQLFSSIYFSSGDIIPGFDNVVAKNGASLQCTFSFISSGAVYFAAMAIPLHSRADFLLGIDCKTAKVTITGNNNQQPETVFRQPAGSRIRNIMHLNVNENTGPIKKLQTRNRILKQLFN